LLHNPTTKGLVRRIVLWDVNVAIVELAILQELVVAIVPACDGGCDTPLKLESVEFLDAIM
jgi:hypothetical protein